MTQEQRKEKIDAVGPLLAAAQVAQTLFWESLADLEREVDMDLDIDNNDLEGYDVETFVDEYCAGDGQ